jgi:hypothetical protein
MFHLYLVKSSLVFSMWAWRSLTWSIVSLRPEDFFTIVRESEILIKVDTNSNNKCLLLLLLSIVKQRTVHYVLHQQMRYFLFSYLTPLLLLVIKNLKKSFLSVWTKKKIRILLLNGFYRSFPYNRRNAFWSDNFLFDNWISQ